ncbi:MAG: T9SS type A sorting domain-containing protein [Ignavibacteriaceae bacterium]|nr:T9SS type A sorting domain-containing protein [Ignavibacteriaceae bacterium]
MKFVKSLFLAALISTVAFAQLTPPANLTATGSSDLRSVKLTWEDTQTNVKYYVYKKDAPAADTTKQFRKIAFVHRKDFVDFHLALGGTYSYYVKAVNFGNISDPSNIVEYTRTAPVYTYGKLNGFVVSEATQLPVINGFVKFLPVSYTVGSYVSVRTDSNGFYSAKLKTGDYKIFYSAHSFIGEYYDNAATSSAATVVTVAENDSVTLNAAALAAVVPPVVYTVSGTVFDAAGLVGKKAEIVAFKKNSNHGPHHGFGQYRRLTDSLGNFSLNVRLGDTLALFARPFDNTLKSEYFDGKATLDEADLIAVTGSVTGINFTLDPKPVYANGVSGTVSDSLGTTFLKGYVYLIRKNPPAPGNHHRRKFWTSTDSLTGAYSFVNLEPGEYYALATAMGYKATYFNFDGTHTLDWRLADSIVVGESGVVENINFNLWARQPYSGGNHAAIFGSTLELTGSVVEGVLTYVTDAEGNVVSASVSDPAGSFAHEGLANGYYMFTANTISFDEAVVSGIDVDTDNGDTELNISLTPDGVTSVKGNTLQPDKFELLQNYPNPFNPSTVIRFSLPEASAVTLRVYNVIGQEIAVLVNNELRAAGSHEVSFNANAFANGVYIYKLESAGLSMTKKMTLLK